MHKLRGDLPPLTDRIAKLPVDERGYPIPFFVAAPNGKVDFRIADGRKWKACVQMNLCWCCGQRLGAHLAFPIGPMCAITRTTAEPPSHLDCAEWSVKGCPFLSKPQMVRRDPESAKEIAKDGAGIMIERNPGVTCIWVTKDFRRFADGGGQVAYQRRRSGKFELVARRPGGDARGGFTFHRDGSADSQELLRQPRRTGGFGAAN